MTTIHYTDLPKTSGLTLLPTKYWMGLALFGSLWLVPVLTLIAFARA